MNGFNREVIGAFADMDERVRALEEAVAELAVALQHLAITAGPADWRVKSALNIAKGVESDFRDYDVPKGPDSDFGEGDGRDWFEPNWTDPSPPP